MDLTDGMMVFVRASGLLALFPIFSTRNFPLQLRVALAAMLAVFITPALPDPTPHIATIPGLVGVIAMELGVGLLLGFTSRMIFYTLDMAGQIIGFQMGLMLSPGENPMSQTQVTAPGVVLYYLAAMLWLTLDLHHWLLIGFQKTYSYLPIGGASLVEASLLELVQRTSRMFLIAVQISAPLIAVAFVINLVFSVLGRAVPQMNVFILSFNVRTLAGLIVFGLTLHLMAQHIINYLRRLPEDILRLAQLLGAG
jgi:flagellar biosynthesis protein FliR